MARVIIYARVSTSKQAEKEISIPAQIKELRDKFDKGGNTITEITDEAKSGRDEDRVGMNKILDMASKREFDELWAWHYDRIGRTDLYTNYILYILKHNNIKVRTINDPDGQKLKRAIDVLVADIESDRISQRVTIGMKEMLRRGKAIGKAPFGYKMVYDYDGEGNKIKGTQRIEIDEEQAKIIRELFQDAKIMSMHQLEEKYKPMNDRLTVPNIQYILRNPVYKTGIYTAMGIEVEVGKILEEET